MSGKEILICLQVGHGIVEECAGRLRMIHYAGLPNE